MQSGRISIFSRALLSLEFRSFSCTIAEYAMRAAAALTLPIRMNTGENRPLRAAKSIYPPADFSRRADVAREIPFLPQTLNKHRLRMAILNWIIIVNCRYANVIRALGSLRDTVVEKYLVRSGRGSHEHRLHFSATLEYATSSFLCCFHTSQANAISTHGGRKLHGYSMSWVFLTRSVESANKDAFFTIIQNWDPKFCWMYVLKGNNVEVSRCRTEGEVKSTAETQTDIPRDLFFEVLLPDRLVILSPPLFFPYSTGTIIDEDDRWCPSRWALVHNADGAFVCGALDWRLVVRHTADVVLLRRYEMSALINRGRWEPFASATVCRNRPLHACAWVASVLPLSREVNAPVCMMWTWIRMTR